MSNENIKKIIREIERRNANEVAKFNAIAATICKDSFAGKTRDSLLRRRRLLLGKIKPLRDWRRRSRRYRPDIPGTMPPEVVARLNAGEAELRVIKTILKGMPA